MTLQRIFTVTLGKQSAAGWYQAIPEGKAVRDAFGARALQVCDRRAKKRLPPATRALIRLQSRPSAKQLRGAIIRVLPRLRNFLYAVITGSQDRPKLSFLRHDDARNLGRLPRDLPLPAPGNMVKIHLVAQKNTGRRAHDKKQAISHLEEIQRREEMESLYREEWDARKQLGSISLIAENIACRFPDFTGLPEIPHADFVDDTQSRIDLRDKALVTIDDESARDFDDAVWASRHENGWQAIIAIADVAQYVHPDTALDKMARARGNSIYLDDTVIPMLPESLSNGMCSLLPDRDRACVFVEIIFDQDGTMQTHKFGRGIMCSHARLTYSQTQGYIDGSHNAPDPIAASIQALISLYRTLDSQAQKRQQLLIPCLEQTVTLDDAYRVQTVAKRISFDAHRLIEYMMVAANICAARELLARNIPFLSRTHEAPTAQTFASLQENLALLGITTQPLKVRGDLNKILQAHPSDIIAIMILRAQAQARYSLQHIGHFGLGLEEYCHFTSPIRRYADLTIHRALIVACDLGGI
ncbi:MAG: RNB domain-containing ribonuclease, partial [Pseudomonadota bacterium]